MEFATSPLFRKLHGKLKTDIEVELVRPIQREEVILETKSDLWTKAPDPGFAMAAKIETGRSGSDGRRSDIGIQNLIIVVKGEVVVDVVETKTGRDIEKGCFSDVVNMAQQKVGCVQVDVLVSTIVLGILLDHSVRRVGDSVSFKGAIGVVMNVAVAPDKKMVRGRDMVTELGLKTCIVFGIDGSSFKVEDVGEFREKSSVQEEKFV